MGTNYYIQRKVPRMVPKYDRTHVCKSSFGWRVHFDGSSAAGNSWDELDEHSPRVGSIGDLRDYLDTGDWELLDEYGCAATLDEVLAHDDWKLEGLPFNTRVALDDYYDEDGYPWSRIEFR